MNVWVFPSIEPLRDAILEAMTISGDYSLEVGTLPPNPCRLPDVIGLIHQGNLYGFTYQDIPREGPEKAFRLYWTWKQTIPLLIDRCPLQGLS